MDLLGSRSGAEEEWHCGAGADGQWTCARDPALVPDPAEAAPGAAADPVGTDADANTDAAEARVDAKTDAVEATPARAPAAEARSAMTWPAEHYAVQVIALESAVAATAFAARVPEPGLHQVVLDSGGQLFHVLVVGSFAERSEAVSVATRLDRQLPSTEPWVRSVATLQAAMGRAAP